MRRDRRSGGPRPDPRAEPVGHAPAADGDPAVRGALGVGIHVGGVPDRLRAVPAQAGPGFGGQGLGHDHRTVHGQQPAVLSGQRGRESLGGAHDPSGVDVPGGGADPSRRRGGPVPVGVPPVTARRLPAGRRTCGVRRSGPGPACAREMVTPRRSDRVRQPPDQLGRMDAGTVRAVEAPQRVRHRQPAPDLAGAQFPFVVGAERPRCGPPPAPLAAGPAGPRSLPPPGSRPGGCRPRCPRRRRLSPPR